MKSKRLAMVLSDVEEEPARDSVNIKCATGSSNQPMTALMLRKGAEVMNSFTSLLFLLCLLAFLLSSTADVASAVEPFTQEEVDTLLLIRPLVFGGSKIQAALDQSTINGMQPPIFGYNAADRALISWIIDDAMADSFAQAIGLPPYMSLAKVSRITARHRHLRRGHGHPPYRPKRYYMIVDIANTERFVVGTKVEWKTFVTVGADPVPRILRFDSQNADPGVDLLDVVAVPFGYVEWRIEDGLASGLITNNEYMLDISIPFKPNYGGSRRRHKSQRFTEEFLTASEHVYSPLSSHSRYYYDGSSVSAEMVAVRKDQVSITNTFPWAAYIDELDSVTIPAAKTKHLVQPIGIPVAQDSYESQLFAQLAGMILSGADQEDVFQLLQTAKDSDTFPTLYYGVLDLYQALQIYAGEELPKMVFSLKKTPMAIFINFEIRDENLQAFKDAFVPDHFELAKMRFYPEQRKAVYAVSLNVYEAVGQNISGYRAEWSTYVINPREENPKPRFSVIEAQTSSMGFDPLVALKLFDPDQFDPNNLTNLLEDPAEVFEFSADAENGIDISIVDVAEDIHVDVSIAYPEEEDILRTRPLVRWMESNDFAYWGEAADILKYDSNVMFAKLIVFRAGPGDMIEDTAFAEYVDPKPLPIILWDGVQDIALEPWGNVQDIIPKTPTPTPVVCRAGDVNDDGEVNLFDVLRCMEIILEIPPVPNPHEWCAADLVIDGEINLFDVVVLIDMVLAT